MRMVCLFDSFLSDAEEIGVDDGSVEQPAKKADPVAPRLELSEAVRAVLICNINAIHEVVVVDEFGNSEALFRLTLKRRSSNTSRGACESRSMPKLVDVSVVVVNIFTDGVSGGEETDDV